jgi:hypothetical protein
MQTGLGACTIPQKPPWHCHASTAATSSTSMTVFKMVFMTLLISNAEWQAQQL